jgi:hypothetical protein
MSNNLENLEKWVKDFENGSITVEELASRLSSIPDPLGNEDDIIKAGEEINNSLNPEKLILTDDEINDLICKYEGEELGNRIVWKILEKLGLTTDLKEFPDFSNNNSFEGYFEKLSLQDRLQRAKEMLFDNLDLDLIGIKIKNPNLKKRNFKILGFNFPLNIISYKGKPLFFHIPPPKVNLSRILQRLRNRIKSKKVKSCEKKGSFIDEEDLLRRLENLLNDEKEEYNNVFEIADEVFCEPNIPINPETGESLFNKNDLTQFLKEICEPEIPEPEIPVDPEPNIDDISDTINSCLKQTKSIFNEVREKNEEKSRLQKAEKELEEILFHYRIVQNYYEELYSQFEKKSKAGKKGNPLKLALNLILGSGADNYINKLNQFSSRFQKTKKIITPGSKYIGISFGINFPHGLGNQIPYERVKMEVNNDLLSQDYQKVDTSKLQIGMEFNDNGVLAGQDSSFFKSFDSFLQFRNENPKNKTDYYSFVSEIENSNRSRQQIVKGIEEDHGFLYSNLIEASASPWLFFTAQERGDNDARKSADIKPAKTDKDGNPNPEFESFWQDFKTKWDQKYNEKKKTIEDKIAELKKLSDPLVEKIADYYLTVSVSSVKNNTDLLKGASDGIKSRVSAIENCLMSIAERITKLDQENSPENLSNKANSVSCASKKEEKCPTDCCGPAGQSVKLSDTCASHRSPDCPNIFTKCYWKEFCKNLNKVGLLPLPAGLPPIENPAAFLPNLGLKYWPVGYLPPSFIPLPPPIVNPLDGLPFIRIPMPMVWTKVDPVVIPIGIGVIVIFIPFIGGFMPSPLVFFHDFLSGNSMFLLGIRGFRFIPRKSDPVSRDPLENYKKMLSRGIPNYLFPFSNLGKDNVDDPKRLFGEVISNLEKRLANYSKPINMEKVRKVQDKIAKKKEEAQARILEKKRKIALEGGDFKKDQEELTEYLKSLDGEKIEAIKDIAKEYLTGAVDIPDLQFPKKSNNLLFDLPQPIKALRDLNAKRKLGIIPDKIPKINLLSRILRGVDSIKIPTPKELDELNKNLPNNSKIVARFDNKLKDLANSPEDIKKLEDLIKKSAVDLLEGENSPLNSKKLLSFKAKITPAPRIGGAGVPLPSGLEEIPNPVISQLKSFISSNIKINTDQLSSLVSNLSIADNKIIRQRDLKMITKNVINSSLSNFPIDLKNFSIPDPASMKAMLKSFTNLASSLNLPAIPPKKSASPVSPIGPGGIPPIIIPGKVISKFLVDNAISAVNVEMITNLLPGVLENFENLSDTDIKTMSDNVIKNFTKSAKIPAIDSIPQIPLQSRPQDYIEFTMNFLPTHPISDIAFTQLWNKFKTPPRIPIPGDFIQKYLDIQDAIFSKVPWPVVVILGRNVINILNPLWNNEDIPRWDRMNLKNPFYVVFMDEFLRSAVDISGGFKFFVGAGNLFYPLPDSEINFGFGTKITIN